LLTLKQSLRFNLKGSYKSNKFAKCKTTSFETEKLLINAISLLTRKPTSFQIQKLIINEISLLTCKLSSF